MKHNVYSALASLKPTQSWSWSGTDYSGLKWNDSGPVPSESVASNVTVNDVISSSNLNVFAESPTTAGLPI